MGATIKSDLNYILPTLVGSQTESDDQTFLMQKGSNYHTKMAWRNMGLATYVTSNLMFHLTPAFDHSAVQFCFVF